ncbi:2-oxo acid dehydrogenase subunit E2 [Streptomyces sp. NPDC003393]
MAVSVPLPALGESVTEGTVTHWLKNVGDTVEADEPLLEIATDKVDTEIPSPAAGVLLRITVAEDETVEVGAELAVIGAPEEAPGPGGESTPAPDQAPPPSRRPSVPAAGAEPAPPAAGAEPAPPAPEPVAAPPAPVAPAPVAPPPAPEPPMAPAPATVAPQTAAQSASLRGRTVALPRIRKVIGDNMMKALHEQAQLTTFVEADVTRLMRLRTRAKDDFAARTGVSLSPMPFFVKAAAQALKAHPVVNARLDRDAGTITYFDTENIGIAVDTDKGLMTPVIKDAGDLNIAGIARATAELAGRARTGGLTPDDVSGATFTLSNTGSRGILFDTVIVPPDQTAILGVGAVVRRLTVVETDGAAAIGIRDMVFLSLSYDHRLMDGADAARYLGTVKALLESEALGAELVPSTES